PLAVAVDSSGSVAAVGNFSQTVNFAGNQPLTASGPNDLFIVKYDSAGNHVWSKHFGAVSVTAMGTGVGFDANGNVVVVGTLTNAVNLGGGPVSPSGFLAKYSAATG